MPGAGVALQIKCSAPGGWVGLTKEHMLIRATEMELKGLVLIWRKLFNKRMQESE